MEPLQTLLESKGWLTQSVNPLSGGSINDVFKVVLQDQKHFVIKKNTLQKYPKMFEREAEGLKLLQKSSFKVPEVIEVVVQEPFQYLILEYVSTGVKSKNFWKDFAFQLAEMHQLSSNEFGSVGDNYMGALAQSNKNHVHWSSFYLNERIAPQLLMASNRRFFTYDEVKDYINKIESWLNDQPKIEPSLVHGDLWLGNFMVDDSGNPVLIDPAVHFGNRETDIAMTRLFGGFSDDFYLWYQEFLPMPKGWQQRTVVYHLYPLLIHLNLFGAGYLHQVRKILDQL